jgi:hypothetical protein
MDLADQTRAQCIVNCSVAGNSRLPDKVICANQNMKMALATLLVSGMTTMLFALIGHLKLSRIKHILQCEPYFFLSRHFFAHPPFKLIFNSL